MRGVMLSLPLLLVAVGAGAGEARVDRIDVIDKGLYAVEAGGETQDTDTPTGAITAVPAADLVESTDTVPARVGVEFGFRYIVVGEPAGAEVTLDIVNIYPEPGLRAPDSQEPFLKSAYRRTKRIGETAYLGYGLENAWEAVPGTWTFEIWHAGRKLADQSFTVEE